MHIGMPIFGNAYFHLTPELPILETDQNTHAQTVRLCLFNAYAGLCQLGLELLHEV